ncbi:MAG: P1 family peptidase [Burkholderiales bacterium]|nr:P1 family peptidase [Burkholderiales bacterium]
MTTPTASPFEPSALPDTACHGRELEFDFPGLRIGVAEYPRGPTGVTVFHFPRRAKAAVDVRGGLPGTYNVDVLRLGYDVPLLDAIGISGGSWYGLQAAGGIAQAMKEDELRSGGLGDLANVAGAIIYDFGDRRLNEIHPDAALGAAALRAAREGRFPLGAHGAGRMAVQGHYHGLPVHSGQGGAFRQVGAVKIAAFVVANPVGLIVDREGRIVADPRLLPPGVTHIRQLLADLPIERDEFGMARATAWNGHARRNPANTTISVVVTNARLPFADLQRLAYQVHGSMGRGIQPFATAWDGDVLFAASTDEVELGSLHAIELGTIASEVMWDALLCAHTPRHAEPPRLLAAAAVSPLDASFEFDRHSRLHLEVAGEQVEIEVTGSRPVFGLPQGSRIEARLQPDGRFVTTGNAGRALRDGGFGAGSGDEGRPQHLVVNFGAWQQVGRRLD